MEKTKKKELKSRHVGVRIPESKYKKLEAISEKQDGGNVSHTIRKKILRGL